MSEQKGKLTRREKFMQQRGEAARLKEQTGFAGYNKNNIRMLGALLALFAFGLYANTLGHEFVLDDSNAIFENHYVKQGVKSIPTLLASEYRAGYWAARGDLYRPLSLVMFAVEWELFPNNPFPGHLINVLLYALTALLLFTLLHRLLPQVSVVVPFFITLLFVAHPIHTEVVANIKSRDELLSFFFVITSLHLLLNYLNTGKPLNIVLSAALYFLALMSKEGAITMLGALPVLLFFFTNENKSSIAKITGAFLVPAVVFLALRGIVLGQQTGQPFKLLLIDNFLLAATTAGEKTATSVMLLGKYLGMLFFPHPLSIDYAYNQIPVVNWANWKPWVSLAAYVALIGIALLRFRKKELWVFGIIFYLISMTLYSNLIITIGSGFGERFLYVASLGFCITLVGLAAALLKNLNVEKSETLASAFSNRKALTGVMALLAVAGSARTVARNPDWKDHFSIYAADVKSAPNSARLNYWYGNEIMKEKALKATTPQEKIKYLDEAIAQYDKALGILKDYADAYGQRGLAYYRKGMTDKAEADYKEAIRLEVGQWKVYNNLGVVYGERNDLQNALKYFQYALKVDYRFPDPHKNMGSVYQMLGEVDKAIEKYLDTLKYCSEAERELKSETYKYLADCYAMKGDKANEAKYRRLAEQTGR